MAGFLDSLTNVFTGKPGTEAADATRAFIAGQQGAVDANAALARSGGLASLSAGREGALGSIGPGFAQGRMDVYGSTPLAVGSVGGYTNLGSGALTGGQEGGLAALQSGVLGATGAYDPLKAAAVRYGAGGTAAQNASADAMGLNGPEGVARAQAAFMTSPGYQFQLGQGLDALTRASNAAGGGTAGGNVLTEAQKYGSGLAAQEWDKYKAGLVGQQQLLSPLERGALGDVATGTANAALTGGTGASNIYTGTAGRLADLYSGAGKTVAPIYAQQGQSLADLASKGALAEAGVYTGTAGQEADLYSKIFGTQAGFAGQTLKPYFDASKLGAEAELGGSKNLWNLIGGAATGGTKLAGSLFG